MSNMICPTYILHPFPAPHFKNLQVFLIYFPKCPSCSTIQSYAPNVALHQFLPKFKSSVLVKRAFFLLNGVFAMAILDLISRVHPASFVIMLP